VPQLRERHVVRPRIAAQLHPAEGDRKLGRGGGRGKVAAPLGGAGRSSGEAV
jgi:hypothetical protein